MKFTSNKLENLKTRKMKKEKVILTSVAALMSVTSVAGITADANAEVLKTKDLADQIHSESASKKATIFEEAERNLLNAKGFQDRNHGRPQRRTGSRAGILRK